MNQTNCPRIYIDKLDSSVQSIFISPLLFAVGPRSYKKSFCFTHFNITVCSFDCTAFAVSGKVRRQQSG